MSNDLIQKFEDALIADRIASSFLEAKDFPTEEALKQYLKDHPKADPSNHKVTLIQDYKTKAPKKKAPYIPLMHQYPKHRPKPDSGPEGGTKTASGMRECTLAEYQQALAKANWPEPRYMNSKRSMTKLFMDRGTEVAEMTEISTRGKKPQVLYMCNPDYLT
jgi:hypothetical protein